MNKPSERIAKYLTRFTPGRVLDGDEDLFAGGIITSLSAIQLLAFVEREFQLTIENEDLVRENFRTIHALSALVERKLASPPPVDEVLAAGTHAVASPRAPG